ncbi:MAG: hypothetical protein KGR26_06695 [Cyanobacteria bacterium REEB65]|nr:hypothetical protein [Cyanobacteria bacterium REEB65]
MITTIPDCPRCGSANTYVGITIPSQFGCLACGYSQGPDGGFLEPADEPEAEVA